MKALVFHPILQSALPIPLTQAIRCLKKAFRFLRENSTRKGKKWCSPDILGYCFVSALSSGTASVRAQSLSQLRSRARQIEEQISQIRELTFKRSVEVDLQSASDFQVYAERQIDQQYSAMDWEYYDRVVRKLGLYRGEIIVDRSLVLEFLQVSALAYYDPEKDKFFILKQNLPGAMLDGVLAHELCHGLQDQHFDLDQFLRAQINTLNSDEILARRAVGEGDATYVETIWILQNRLGRMPGQRLLESVIGDQMGLDVQTLREGIKQIALLQGGSRQVLETIESLPGFMILQQAAAYVFGLNFVYQNSKTGMGARQSFVRKSPCFNRANSVSSEMVVRRNTGPADLATVPGRSHI